MARVFTGFPVTPYIGVPFFKPVEICKPYDGSTPTIGEQPQVVPLEINWLSYSPFFNVNNQIGITVNLEGQGGQPKPPLNRIEAVYIDNSFSAVPVFVFFPDTGYVASAGANRITMVPVYTNDLRCVIYADQFDVGSTPFTRVILMNRYVDTFNIDTTFLTNVPPMSWELLVTSVSASNSSSYSFLNQQIGPAEERRLYIFATGLASAVAARNINSITVAGLPATRVGGTGATALIPVQAWYIDLTSADPTGLQTITVTYSGNMVGSGLSVIRVYDMQQALPYAVHNGASGVPGANVDNAVGYAGGLIFGYGSFNNTQDAAFTRQSLSVFQPSIDSEIQYGYAIQAATFTWNVLDNVLDDPMDAPIASLVNIAQCLYMAIR